VVEVDVPAATVTLRLGDPLLRLSRHLTKAMVDQTSAKALGELAAEIEGSRQ
jgi:hypothetical protein